jgi:hypothetical protein
MAMAVRWCNTKHIAQCSMSRATPEATGCRHRVTTCSVLPQQPPGQQANKQQSTNAPKKLAILMAAAVHLYNTTHIAQYRRSRASLEATGCHHRVSTCSDKHQSDIPTLVFFEFFSSSTCTKRSQIDAKAPVFNKGITYQTKERGLTKVSI